MKNTLQIAVLVVVLLVGATVSTLLDYNKEKRQAIVTTQWSAGQMARFLSLYPLAESSQAARDLLAKSLVEQSRMRVAYLMAYDADGVPLLNMGDLRLSGEADPAANVPTSGLTERRFRAPDAEGDIFELRRAVVLADQVGSLVVGVRLVDTPLFSSERIRAASTVLLLMLAAIFIVYYTLLLLIRSSIRQSPELAGLDQNANTILSVFDNLRKKCSSAQAQLEKSDANSASLSSVLGVLAFESEQAYRVLDGLPFGLLILDAKGVVRRSNRQFLYMLGCDKADLENPKANLFKVNSALQELIDASPDSQGDASSSVETTFPDTEPDREFVLTRHPLMDATGEIIGAAITTQDVTRINRIYKAQGDFLADAAHELMTPLTSIKGFAEMLADGDYSDEDMQKEFFNTINSETDRLTLLVKNMLNVSSMESGQVEMVSALVKTDWLVNQCMPAVEAAAREKDITIETKLPDVYPNLKGDKEMLKVVLVNILGNAIKYTPPKGTAKLSLFAQNKTVYFEVTDTGCGIPEQDLPLVFEKFYRGKSDAVRDEVGSGLGLATSLQIARLHGGKIEVESTVGKGSCFTISLPEEDYSLENE